MRIYYITCHNLILIQHKFFNNFYAKNKIVQLLSVVGHLSSRIVLRDAVAFALCGEKANVHVYYPPTLHAYAQMCTHEICTCTHAIVEINSVRIAHATCGLSRVAFKLLPLKMCTHQPAYICQGYLIRSPLRLGVSGGRNGAHYRASAPLARGGSLPRPPSSPPEGPPGAPLTKLTYTRDWRLALRELNCTYTH